MRLLDFIKKIRSKGSFANELGISVGGGTMSYLIGFLFTPIISRIYPPSEYGLFALLSSFSINLSLFASLGFDGAILLPKSYKELSSLLKTISLLSVSFATVLCILFVLSKQASLTFFNATGLTEYWYLIPILVLILHITNVVQSLCVRLGAFKRDAIAKMSSITIGKSFVLFYGMFLSPNFFGMALGEIILRFSQIVQIISSREVFSTLNVSFRSIKRREVLEIFRTYKSYPLYFTPANWLNIMIAQLPLYFIAAIYSEETVGYFSFSLSILNLPLMVVGYSFSQVLFRKLLTLHEQGSSLISFSKKSLTILFLVAIIPFSTLFFYGREIYIVIFGENWELSGVFAEILAPFFLIQFLVYPFLSVFRVFRLERTLMIANVLLLISLFSGLSFLKEFEEVDFVRNFSIIGSLLQIFFAIFICFTLKKMSND